MSKEHYVTHRLDPTRREIGQLMRVAGLPSSGTKSKERHQYIRQGIVASPFVIEMFKKLTGKNTVKVV